MVIDVLHPGNATVPETEVWGKLTKSTQADQRSSLYTDPKVILDVERQLASMIYGSLNHSEKKKPKHRLARHNLCEKKKTNKLKTWTSKK